MLADLDPGLAERFDAGFRLAADGDCTAIVAEDELSRHGGPCFAGFRTDAPITARRAAPAG